MSYVIDSQPLLTKATAELLPKNDYIATPAGDVEMEVLRSLLIAELFFINIKTYQNCSLQSNVSTGICLSNMFVCACVQDSDEKVSVFTFVSKKPPAAKVNTSNTGKLQIVAAYGLMDDTSSSVESYTALAKRVTKHLQDVEQGSQDLSNEDSVDIIAARLRQQRTREEIEPDSVDQLIDEVAQLDEGQHEVIHALGILDKPKTDGNLGSVLNDDKKSSSKGTNNNNGTSLPPLSPPPINNKALASTLAKIVEDIDGERNDSRERLRRLVMPPPKQKQCFNIVVVVYICDVRYVLYRLS